MAGLGGTLLHLDRGAVGPLLGGVVGGVHLDVAALVAAAPFPLLRVGVGARSADLGDGAGADDAGVLGADAAVLAHVGGHLLENVIKP